MKINVRSVAKEAGVSPATVSRYYTGKGIVSTELSRKIEAAAEKLGYERNHTHRYSETVIAVLVPHLRIRFFQEVLQEIIEQIPRYNFRVVFIPVLKDSDDYKKFFHEINIGGVIYLDEEIDADVLKYISSKNIQTVMCGGVSFDQRSKMVHINDMAAAYDGTRYLMGFGHRNILVLSDKTKSISSGFQRLMGVKRAFEEADLTLEQNMCKFGDMSYRDGCRLVREALDEGLDFTAVFAFSDQMALGAMHVLAEAGVKVPEDVSVLGFDDLEEAAKSTPELTTIHQPLKEFVSQTLDTFVHTREYKSFEIMLPYKIIERRSCSVRRKKT
ncbi:MAG: LacI family DNA-binding transcriptional regulator [Lachnospiraceae bacterium]|nr:LacI family DNA-binding transcriptional regulator [Lachnospiraceae bacterium]